MRRHVALGERVLPECAAKRALLDRCRALQIAVDRRAIVAAVDWRDDDDDYHDDDDDPTNDDALAANPGLEPSSDANVARLAAGGGGPRDPEEEPGRLSRWTRSIPPPADVVAALPPTLDAEIVGDCARPAGGPGKVAPWWFADAVVVIARAGEGFGDDEDDGDDENGDDENGDDEGTIFRGRRGEENETEEENGGVPAAETPPQRGVPAGTQHPEVSVPGVSVPEVIADLPVPASRILALRRAASQMRADRLPGVFVLLEAKKTKGPRTSKSANDARDEADDPSGEDGAKKCASSSKSGGESGGESGGVSSAFDVASWFSSSAASASASASAAPPPSSRDHHPADPDAVARLIARRAGLGPSSRVLVSAATGCSVLNDSGRGASARLAAWREGASEWYRAWAFRRAARYAAAFAADRDCVRFWAAMAPGGAEPGGAVAEGGTFAEGGAVLSRKSAVSSDSERKSPEGDASSKAATAAADSTTDPPNVDASASSASSSSASAAASSIASAAHDARLAASLVSLGSFLRTAVEGIRSVGFAGAEELAERHSGTLSRHSKNANNNEKAHHVNPEDERQRLTNALYRAGALEYAAGFVLSWAVPGPLAAHAAHFTNRFRMALCCASLAGESVLAPATVATAVAVAAGGDGKAVRDGFKRRDYWMSSGADDGFVARRPTGSAARDRSEEEEEEEVSISHASSSVPVTSSKEEAEEASSSSVSSVSSSKPPSAPQSAFGGSVGAAFRALAANGEKLRAKAERAARAAVEGVTGAADDAARLADEDARAEAAEARRRAARIVREIREEGFLEGNYISGGDSEGERAAHDEHKRERERELESSSLELDLGLDADRLARLAWVRHRSSSLAARLSMVVCGPVWLAATQADVTSVVAGAMSARVAEASVATFLPSLLAEEWAARARRRRREAARLTSEEGFVAVRVETIPWGGGGGASELERERERERSEDRDEVDEAMRDLATRARVILTVEAYPTPLHKRVAEGTKRGFEEATKVTTDAVMGATKATTDAVKEATKVTTDAVQNATKATTDAVQNATKATTDAVQNATKATTDAFHTASTSVTHSFAATARWVDAVARAAAAGAAAGAARASETMTTAFDSSSDNKKAARARLLARRLRAAPDGFVEASFEEASEHSSGSRLARLAYGRKIASAFADPETRAAVSRPGLAMRLMTDARIARSLRTVPEAAAAFAALTNGDAEAFVVALEKDAGVAALARRALEVVVESADPAAVEAATKHGLLIPETEDEAEDAEDAERADAENNAGKENDEPGGAAVEDGGSSWSFESLFKGATATEG